MLPFAPSNRIEILIMLNSEPYNLLQSRTFKIKPHLFTQISYNYCSFASFLGYAITNAHFEYESQSRIKLLAKILGNSESQGKYRGC